MLVYFIGHSRYVALYGNDKMNNCTTLKQPCGSFKHAISESKENDTIAVICSQNITGQRDVEINSTMLGKALPLVITKSLNFVCISAKCHLHIPKGHFAFVAGHISKQINLSFVNFEVSQEKTNERSNTKCNPTSNGFIVLKECKLELRNCILRRMCTAVYIFSLKDDVCEINITKAAVERVHYIVYSSNASFVNINMRDTTVKGEYHAIVPYHTISLITRGTTSIHIANCVFYRVNEAVAISLYRKKLLLKIEKCHFKENYGQSILLSFSSQLQYDESIIHLESLTFSSNDAGFASSLHLIRQYSKNSFGEKPAPNILLNNSIFENNYAEAFFGAIYAEGVDLTIENTIFNNNSAGNEESSIQAFGGAIFVESRTNVKAFNSSFIGNTCSGFGGAVFSRGNFSATNCLFHGTFEDATSPLLGDILYVTAGLYLENTTWHPSKSYRSNSAIWHPGSPKLEGWTISIQGYLHISCPIGHNITGHGYIRQQGMSTDRISMGCRSCQRDEYSLHSGHLMVVSSRGRILSKYERKVSCKRCRYGGVCEKGKIRARSNYYGYLMKELKEVRFISCPYGYCCQGQDCKSYNSCSPLRHGTLCGSCIKGTTENLLNARCVHGNNCRDKWFWFLYFPFGIIYILFFMYIDKISKFLKGQLLWWEERIESTVAKNVKENDDCIPQGKAKEDYEPLHTDEDQLDNNEDLSIREDNLFPESCGNFPELSENKNADEMKHIDQRRESETSINNANMSNMSPHRNEESPYSTNGSMEDSNNEKSDIFSDIINISFYFYQIIFIIRDHDNTVLTETFALVKEMSNSFFTFSIGSKSVLSLCPIEGLTPVTKNILVRSIALYVIGMVLLMNAVDTICMFITRKLKTTSELELCESKMSFSVRLRVTTIQIMLLAYSTVTNMTINVVNCVPINGHLVLYMDGTIRCFNWFQVLALLFIIFWVVPFPFALVLGIHSMHCSTMSYYQFIFALIFPFCYVFWDTVGKYVKRCAIKQLSGAKNYRSYLQADIVTVEGNSRTIDKLSVEEVLRRFEAPFKGKGDEKILVRQPGIWQGVLIMRRLVIILLFAFVNSPVTRLYCIFIACLLFLIHHLICLPYKNSLANLIETCSSATLVVFCSVNLFFAYSYVSNVPPENADNRISDIFNWFEVIILVFFPVLFCVLLMLFVLFNCCMTIYRVLHRIIDC